MRQTKCLVFCLLYVLSSDADIVGSDFLFLWGSINKYRLSMEINVINLPPPPKMASPNPKFETIIIEVVSWQNYLPNWTKCFVAFLPEVDVLNSNFAEANSSLSSFQGK
ncbi:Hypothetical predicted protein [Octopus vulgaris]|uniref:Uncharacterized protein n=1 Tax=Octopus vulgaris TaxID=6645 RepID=A0AA36BTW9_OCTVU|nr:Hypothetical predicted protein [Octopus vulgaris]